MFIFSIFSVDFSIVPWIWFYCNFSAGFAFFYRLRREMLVWKKKSSRKRKKTVGDWKSYRRSWQSRQRMMLRGQCIPSALSGDISRLVIHAAAEVVRPHRRFSGVISREVLFCVAIQCRRLISLLAHSCVTVGGVRGGVKCFCLSTGSKHQIGTFVNHSWFSW